MCLETAKRMLINLGISSIDLPQIVKSDPVNTE